MGYNDELNNGAKSVISNKTIREALEIMSHFRISGVPVVDNNKLVGILTNRDIRFEKNIDLRKFLSCDFCEIVNKRVFFYAFLVTV